MEDGLKIVIIVRNEKAIVGIQAPDCDPVLTVEQGSLEELVGRLPGLVARAREQWLEKPQYPKTTRIPAPAPAPPRPQAAPAKKMEPVTQTPRMF